ncbi:MAG: AAA family ATPase [Chloroflexi bacterium]|nr:AAA family ATPase [Chloroflexota bacterium]
MNSTQPIRLLLVDAERDTLSALEQLLSLESTIQIVGTATSLHDALFAAEQKMPDVVLVAVVGGQGADGLQISQAIAERLPATRILMVIPKSLASAEYLQRVLLAGAREFIIRPFESAELLEGIRRTAYAAPSAGPMPLSPGSVIPGSAPRLAAIAPPPPPPPSRHGRIIAVYSANGGIGRTTLAVNLAIALQTGGIERVALMDASLRYGDVGVYMNLRSQRTITDICSSNGKVDLAALPDVLAAHHSGVKVLLAPASPELADTLTPHAVDQVLNALRDQFDYVIVDTFSALDETMLTILDHADRIVLVATSEVHVVKNMRLFLEVAELLKYPANKMMLVLNRHNPKGRVSPKEIESAIGQPIVAVIERDDKTAVEAVQSGLPFVISSPKTPISQVVLHLAQHMAPELRAAGSRPKHGLFGAR